LAPRARIKDIERDVEGVPKTKWLLILFNQMPDEGDEGRWTRVANDPVTISLAVFVWCWNVPLLTRGALLNESKAITILWVGDVPVVFKRTVPHPLP
jgi:hypothetical protein